MPVTRHQLYLLSLFTSTPQENINGLWNIYFSGLARANNVITSCENAVGFETDAEMKRLNQYKAEAHFLRAYYTHWLWKFWGNIPYFEEPLTEPPYMTRQYTADEIYAEIMQDIDVATTEGWLPMSTTGANTGRINRAAALMLKARVVMYQKDESRYAEVTSDMAEIIKSNEYELFDDLPRCGWMKMNFAKSQSSKQTIFLKVRPGLVAGRATEPTFRHLFRPMS